MKPRQTLHLLISLWLWLELATKEFDQSSVHWLYLDIQPKRTIESNKPTVNSKPDYIKTIDMMGKRRQWSFFRGHRLVALGPPNINYPHKSLIGMDTPTAFPLLVVTSFGSQSNNKPSPKSPEMGGIHLPQMVGLLLGFPHCAKYVLNVSLFSRKT